MGRLQSTASTGDPLKLSEINTQFNATNQSLRAFLRDGTYVKSSDINSGSVGAIVPTTGTIKMSDLLGKSEVYITNHSLSALSSTTGANSASATVRLRSDGTFTWTRQSSTQGSTTGSYTGEWLPGNKNPGDYSVEAVWTLDVGVSTGGTFTGTEGVGVWSALSTTQEWTLATSSNTQNGDHEALGTLVLSIKNNSDNVILDTATITLSSTSTGNA